MAIVDSAGDAAAVAVAFQNTILGGAGGALAALLSGWVAGKMEGESYQLLLIVD